MHAQPMNDALTLHTLDVEAIRNDFPILKQESDPRLIYLDSAATSQTPDCVVNAMDEYYRTYNANIHRGIYRISEEATARYEEARKKIARFINARRSSQIVFTRNTTESINLVAYSWGSANIREGDEILVTVMEHHSNLLPWQLLAQRTGAKLRFIEITEEGLLQLDDLDRLLTERTRIVAMTHVSNVLGTINPIQDITAAAHAVGAKVLIDAAQSVPHLPVDVQQMDCDFLAFSGHKMCGPTGIGVLYGKLDLLEEMPPFLVGGSTIRSVQREHSIYADPPAKFEAGTPSIAEAIGLGAAVDYLRKVGLEAIYAHEHELLEYAHQKLSDIEGLTIYGPKPRQKTGAISLNLDGIHPHDLAGVLDVSGVAIRAGHHCAQPLMQQYDVIATARASFYLYNTLEEIDRLYDGLLTAKKIFTRRRR
ncbi:MAG: cysteine desulfurase [Candidatus Poribacteria bacterium]|nr:cysteine desulfurase [Candidatus Poribacteria bacterium]